MPTLQTLPTQWVNKEAVANRLKVSERTVLTLVTKIKAEKQRDPASNQVVWMFDAADVERYALERDSPVTEIPRPSKSAQAAQPPALPTPAPQLALPAPEPESHPDQPVSTRITPRPWLTLDEAAEWSGLTKRWLLEEAESTVNPKEHTPPPRDLRRQAIRDMGKHSPGGRWRFHRESLEKA